MIIVQTYGTYLFISIALTIWVARTLFKNGKVFLVEVFGDEDLAESVNHLLVVGFYLLNLGFVSLNLAIEGPIKDLRMSIESLSTKLGFVILVLGGLHILNLIVFSIIRGSHLSASKRERWMEMHGAVSGPPPFTR